MAVVGGRGRGAVREILKHSSVEKVVLAEIDEAVIEAARRYLPSISSALTTHGSTSWWATALPILKPGEGHMMW